MKPFLIIWGALVALVAGFFGCWYAGWIGDLPRLSSPEGIKAGLAVCLALAGAAMFPACLLTCLAVWRDRARFCAFACAATLLAAVAVSGEIALFRQTTGFSTRGGLQPGVWLLCLDGSCSTAQPSGFSGDAVLVITATIFLCLVTSGLLVATLTAQPLPTVAARIRAASAGVRAQIGEEGVAYRRALRDTLNRR